MADLRTFLTDLNKIESGQNQQNMDKMADFAKKGMKSKDAEMSMASAKILVEYVKFSPDIDIVKFYENLLKQNMSIKSALLFLENCLNFLDEKSDLIKSDLITLFWKFNEIDFKANFSAQLYDFVDFVLILIKNCNNDKTLFFKILNCFQFNGNGSTVSETKNYRILLCAIIKLFIVISAKCPNENYSEFYKLFLFQSNKLENKNINFGLFCENSRCEFYNVLYVTAVIKAIFLHKNRRKWLRIAESHLSESFGSQFDIAKILMGDDKMLSTSMREISRITVAEFKGGFRMSPLNPFKIYIRFFELGGIGCFLDLLMEQTLFLEAVLLILRLRKSSNLIEDFSEFKDFDYVCDNLREKLLKVRKGFPYSIEILLERLKST